MLVHSALICDFLVAFNSSSVNGEPCAISKHLALCDSLLRSILSMLLGLLIAKLPMSLLSPEAFTLLNFSFAKFRSAVSLALFFVSCSFIAVLVSISSNCCCMSACCCSTAPSNFMLFSVSISFSALRF